MLWNKTKIANLLQILALKSTADILKFAKIAAHIMKTLADNMKTKIVKINVVGLADKLLLVYLLHAKI
jgi:hypothetical protein